MRVPIRFLLGLLCGLLLGIGVFVSLLYSQLGVPTNSSGWAYGIGQKKEALAGAISGPRLLLIGGSGVTFGLSAEQIEKETGRPTVNMGTHAALGIEYILDRTEKIARPGDTVLLAIEYQLYGKPFGLDVSDDYILARDPAFFRQMSWLDKIDMATRIPFTRIQKGFAIRRKPESPPRPHPPYTDGVSYINPFGDETGNASADRPAPNAEMAELAVPLVDGMPSDQAFGFGKIREFVRWARAHHVTVLATFPNLMHQPQYDGPNARQAIQVITDFYASLGVPVAGRAQAAILPSDQFFDTPYHLTHEAAIARTDRLVPDLKPYLTIAP